MLIGLSRQWQKLSEWFASIPQSDRPAMLLATLLHSVCFAYLFAFLNALARPVEVAGDKLRVYVLAALATVISAILVGLAQQAKMRQGIAENEFFYERLLLFNALFGLAGALTLYGLGGEFYGLLGLFLAVAYLVANILLIFGMMAIHRRAESVAQPRQMAALFAVTALLIVLISAGIWWLGIPSRQALPEMWIMTLTPVVCVALIAVPALLYRHAYRIMPWAAGLALPLFAGNGLDNAWPALLWAVAVVGGVALAPRLWRRLSAGWRRFLGWGDLAALVWIAALAFDINFLSDRLHFDAFLAPINDLMHGKTLLVDTFAQYGTLQTYFLAAIFQFRLLPLTYPALSAVISAMVVAQFMLAYFLLRVAAKSRWLALATTTLLIGVMIIGAPFPPTRYPATGPLRFIFLYVIMALVALRLSRQNLKRAVTIAEIVVMGIVAVWSSDSLIYYGVTYAALILYEIMSAEPSLETIARQTLTRLAPVAASMGIAIGAISVIIFLQSGEWPAWQFYREIVQFFSSMDTGRAFGYFLVIAPWDPWFLIACGCFASLAALLFKLLLAGGKGAPWRYIVAFGMTIGGMMHFTYWVANSVYTYSQLIPAAFLAIFWLTELAESKQPTLADFALPARVFAVLIAAVLLINFASSPYLPRRESPATLLIRRAGEMIGQPPTKPWNFDERWNLPPNIFYSYQGPNASRVVPDALKAVASFAADQDRIALFLDPDDTVETLVRSGKTDIFPVADIINTSKSPTVIARATTRDYGLKPDDIIFLNRDLSVLRPIDSAILAKVCSQFDLSIVAGWKSGVTAMRLQPAGDSQATCSCDGQTLSCPGVVMIPDYRPGDLLILSEGLPADSLTVAYSLQGGGSQLAISAVLASQLVQTFDSLAVSQIIADHKPRWVWHVQASGEAGGLDAGDVTAGEFIKGQTRKAAFDNASDFAATGYQFIPANSEPLARFGSDITLLAWSRVDGNTSVHTCDSISIESWWKTGAPVDHATSAFVGLFKDHRPVAQTDGPLAGIDITRWIPGAVYRDFREIVVPCDTPPREYALTFGVYLYPEIANLPVSLPDGSPAGGVAELGPISVQQP